MPQYIEVGGVFAPDEGGERDISHHIEHDHGQCGDSTEEAEDLTRSEEDADEQETHNLEDLLYVNRNIGCFVHRVDLNTLYCGSRRADLPDCEFPARRHLLRSGKLTIWKICST